MSIETALGNVPFLEHLTDAQLKDLIAVGKHTSLDANRIILRQGDTADSLYVILAGKVKIYLRDEERNELILNVLGEGDTVGGDDMKESPDHA